MVKKTDVPKVALDAALTLAATTGWRDLTLADVAAEAGIGLGELRRAYPSREALLDGLSDRIDGEVLSGTGADLAGEPVKDRLFDILMRRFEALGPHRDAVRAIARDSMGDPAAALCGGCRLLRSMRWMLEAAGVSTSGLPGLVRTKGLAAIWVDVLRTWLRDDSDDMGPTMAALDRRLAQADDAMAQLCRLTRRGRRAGPVDAAA